MKSRTWIVPIIVTACLCTALIAIAVVMSFENERSQNAAPSFTVVDARGRSVELSSIRNKPVVVNFWATWCTYCLQEMPAFEEAYKKYGDDVVFMMVNMTAGDETVARAKAFIADAGYTFPVYFDENGDAAATYRVSGLPMTLFIKRDGSLYTSYTGTLYKDPLEDYIERLLEKS